MTKREYESRETNQVRSDESSSSSFLLGVIVGGLAGAAAALFLGTKKGQEFRHTLSDQMGSLLDKSSPLRENVKSKTISLTQGLAQQSSNLMNKVKGKTDTTFEQHEDSETTYISIQGSNEKTASTKASANSDEIRKKLEEAQKALEEEESKVRI